MTLLDVIKKLIFLAPTRCGRTYYHCDIVSSEDNIKLTFTPTDKYLLLDPRREEEEFMPAHFHSFEKAEHIGLVIGSLEYYFKRNNINYTVEGTDTVILTVEKTNNEVDTNVDEWKRFKHAHRSFNVQTQIDTETYNLLSDKIDEFLKVNNGHKIMISDLAVVKKLKALSKYWDSDGDSCDGSPQMIAPLVMSVPPKEFDLEYYMQMGRLYSDIGLTAISRGYQFAFSNTFNYPDPRVRRVQEEIFLDYDSYTLDNVVPRSFMCMGKALDPSKPHNWVAEDNVYDDDIAPSCILLTKEFVQIREEVVV